MNIHLVGGFLGSGKTTAIIGAAKLLMAQGKTVGIITNDQGRYLVDTAFFRLADLPTVEVTGGCFCCNYTELDEQIDTLIKTIQPDVIFAESVGSCADLISTVVKPLQNLRESNATASSFSVFTDARLLRLHLMGEELPFSENVSYIFAKQIEEAGLLVVNKRDLLSDAAAEALLAQAREAYPQKAVRLQSAFSDESIAEWAALIESGTLPLPQDSLEIDYDRYGAGEAELAWLDEQLVFEARDGNGGAVVRHLLMEMMDEITANDYPIGHLKYEIESAGRSLKLSFVSLSDDGEAVDVPDLPDGSIRLLVNGRVQVGAEALRALVDEAVRRTASAFGVLIQQSEVDAFHPGFPNPIHRY